MQGKVFFIAYQEIKDRKRGQVAPFLLIVLVILLIATIALVNIAKVGTHRLSTANASDVGALSGAAALASFENTAADINETYMKPLYYGYLLALGYNALVGKIDLALYLEEPFDYAITRYMVGSLLIAYITLLVQGKQACRVARKQAHSSAFGNAGIEEAQKRRRSDKEIQEPNLSNFLQNTVGTDPSYTYTWYQYAINLATGKEDKEATKSSVTSTVTGTEAFCLYPKGYENWYKVYYVPVHNFIRKICAGKDSVPCGCPGSWTEYNADISRVWCIIEQSIWHNLELLGYYVVTIALANVLTGTSECIDDILQETLQELVSQMFTFLVLPVLPPPIPICTKKCCPALCPPPGPCLAPDFCFAESFTPCYVSVPYFIPTPWIEGIANNDADLTVEVTRSEPSRDTGGFWVRKSTTVRSKARARTFGNFDIPGSYDCRLEYTE